MLEKMEEGKLPTITRWGECCVVQCNYKKAGQVLAFFEPKF